MDTAQLIQTVSEKFAAYYYNRATEWGSDAVITYKHDSFSFGSAVPDVERGQFAERKPFFWQTDTAVALNSWCYTEIIPIVMPKILFAI